VALFFLTVLSVSVLLATYAQAAAQPSLSYGQRLVTVHDRGRTRGILTHTTTLRDTFREANIHIDPNDTVEPGLDQALTANNYDVNIYRARPVTIIDGSMRKKVMSPHQTASQIAKQADVSLQKEDITAITANTDMVSQGAGVELTINRAIPINLVLYGTKTKVYTQQATVAELLKEKEIVIAKNDTLSVPVTAKITKDMTIELWRNGVQTATVEEDIDFAVEERQDADRPAGDREVLEPGEKGKKKVTYQIDMKNGQEISRTEIQSVTLKEPKKQVEIVGVGLVLGDGYSAERIQIMTGAGIAPDQQPYAAFIIDHENGLWCPTRWQGTSGCPVEYYEKFPGAESSSQVGYGMCQSTPANKMATMGSDWRTNPVTQMKWCTDYAISRYGSWYEAYAKWRERAVAKTGSPESGGWW
jgi:uncharacterized protein YabE (DUF348 family)